MTTERMPKLKDSDPRMVNFFHVEGSVYRRKWDAEKGMYGDAEVVKLQDVLAALQYYETRRMEDEK